MQSRRASHWDSPLQEIWEQLGRILMRSSNRSNVLSLVKEACSSEHKEAFRVLERTKKYRISLGVRTFAKSLSFFLEVNIYHRLIEEHNTLSDITQQLLLLKKLQKRGYSVSCQDEICTVVEMRVPQDSLSGEVKYLKTIINNTLQD